MPAQADVTAILEPLNESSLRWVGLCQGGLL